MFAANYRSGLRIFDISDPLAAFEIGYLDTYAPNNNAQFNGAWSNYPYLPSGTILISDMEQGLVLVRTLFDRLEFNFPNGRPDTVGPGGADTLTVEIVERNVTLDPASVRLHANGGSGFVELLATPSGTPGHYTVTFPPAPCLETLSYYISARTTTDELFTAPSGAPGTAYTALVASGVEIRFEDDFETHKGWTVTNSPGLTAGAWERGVPVNGGRGDPPTDYDGSGQCYVTDNRPGDSDVDGGFTTLTSPPFDATGGDAWDSYAVWLSNDFDAAP